MKVKEQSEKTGLKLNIQKSKIMASDPIISWQIEGEKIEVMTDFTFLGSKTLWMVTEAMKLKKCLLLGKKTKTNPHSRVITLLTKIRIVKAMVFPIIMS